MLLIISVIFRFIMYVYYMSNYDWTVLFLCIGMILSPRLDNGYVNTLVNKALSDSDA